ncbi:MAG: hypothetical protein SGPRY_011230, partial [Prymnesium sp.]
MAPSLAPCLAREKRAGSPSFERPFVKRQLSRPNDDDEVKFAFSLDSPGSSPQRTCTLSPNFLDDMADELELAPLLLQHADVEDALFPMAMSQFSRGSTMSTPETVQTGKDAFLPPLSLLEAVQPAYMSSRKSSANSLCDKSFIDRPSSPEASMLQSHATWQKKLRSALAEADAGTRALLSPATGRDLYGTVQVLARLSPRQISSLHTPARDLVEMLLKQTREQ